MSKETLLAAVVSTQPNLPSSQIVELQVDATAEKVQKIQNINDESRLAQLDLRKGISEITGGQAGLTDFSNPLFIIKDTYFFDRDTDGGFDQDVGESIRLFSGVGFQSLGTNYRLEIDGTGYLGIPTLDHDMDDSGTRIDVVTTTLVQEKELERGVLKLGFGSQYIGNAGLESIQNGYHRLIQSKEFTTPYEDTSEYVPVIRLGGEYELGEIGGIDYTVKGDGIIPFSDKGLLHLEGEIEGKKYLGKKVTGVGGIKTMYTDFPDGTETFDQAPYDIIDGSNTQAKLGFEYRLSDRTVIEGNINKTIDGDKPGESFIGFRKRFK